MNKASILFAAIVLVVIGAGVILSTVGKSGSPTTPTAGIAPTTTNASYTLTDISAHASASDCWMAIDGNVYNVSSYVNQHPGGQQIVDGCGKDASGLFASIRKHQREATAMLPEFQIGTLKK
jgi:cytochrome b involved in lipid metabolism